MQSIKNKKCIPKLKSTSIGSDAGRGGVAKTKLPCEQVPVYYKWKQSKCKLIMIVK